MCAKCLTCWEDHPKPLTAFFNSVFEWRQNTSARIWKELFTKNCPSCRAHIEKNEGCKHMECIKCRHEFCWDCMQLWRSHSEIKCSGTVQDLIVIVAIVLLLMFILKIIFVVEVTRIVLYYLVIMIFDILTAVLLGGFTFLFPLNMVEFCSQMHWSMKLTMASMSIIPYIAILYASWVYLDVLYYSALLLALGAGAGIFF